MRLPLPQQRIDEAQSLIQSTRNQLAKRANSIYREGSMSMIDVIFGSQSFDDFVTNWDSVERISQQDAALVQQNKDAKAALYEQLAACVGPDAIVASNTSALNIFEIVPEKLDGLCRYVSAQPWASQYEIVPSSVYLLELTAKGASKGEMVQRLARRLNVSMENVYCVGDHANDLGMLALSAIPFAPENAIESVRQVPGIHILPDARHGAIAALIRELDQRY